MKAIFFAFSLLFVFALIGATEVDVDNSSVDNQNLNFPSTEEPTAEVPTTEAPTAEIPTTVAPTTLAPTTVAPTEVPTTEVPTTAAPVPEPTNYTIWIIVGIVVILIGFLIIAMIVRNKNKRDRENQGDEGKPLI